MIKFKNSKAQAITLLEYEEFERGLGYKFPEIYKKMMLEQNGPYSSGISTTLGDEEDGIITRCAFRQY